VAALLTNEIRCERRAATEGRPYKRTSLAQC
jgi:hypothetical protein